MSCPEPRRAGGRLEGVPRELWSRAAAAPRRLLMLDYDGTLAPFRIERDESRPPRRAVERLQAIAASPRTEVAIVSGRPVRSLERLLGPLEATLVGEHGWEHQAPGQSLACHPVPDGTRAVLADAARAAVERGWGDRLERKRASLVLHTRDLAPERTGELERACAVLWGTALGGEDAFRLAQTHGAIELRACGRHKGTAVRELMAATADAYPVYLGDDESDEDAFAEVRGTGVGIRVGPRAGRSLAAGCLDSPQAVASFLRAWLAVVERRSGS